MRTNLMASAVVVAMAAVPSAWPQGKVVTSELAYTHLFLILTAANNEQPAALEQRRAAYIKHLGLTAQEGDKLIAAAEEFQRQEAERRAKAASLIQSGGAGAQARSDFKAQLAALEQDRDRSVLGLANSLLILIGPDAAARLTAYVNGKIKPNVRFVPKISR